MKNKTFRIAAGLLFAAAAVLTLIENTFFALLQGSVNIFTLFDLSDVLALVLLALSAFIATPLLAAIGGAMLGIVNIYFLIDTISLGLYRKSFDVVLLLYYALLIAAIVFIIIFAIGKQSLVSGVLMTALWFLANFIQMTFGLDGDYFMIRLYFGDYLSLIIPVLTVLALLMLALSAKEE